eukprot:6265003-Amphidinium_carterae.1
MWGQNEKKHSVVIYTQTVNQRELTNYSGNHFRYNMQHRKTTASAPRNGDANNDHKMIKPSIREASRAQSSQNLSRIPYKKAMDSECSHNDQSSLRFRSEVTLKGN